MESRFGKLRGIDVDLGGAGMPGKARPIVADLAYAETTPEDQHKVSILDRKISCTSPDGSLPAGIERMIRGNQVMGPGRGDRDPQGFRSPDHQVFRSGKTHSGPGKENRPL